MTDEEKTKIEEENTDEQGNSESGKGKKDEVDYEKLAKVVADKAAAKEKVDEKLFTQAELDETIKTRLAREKSGSGRTSDAQDALLKTANDQIDQYEKVLKKQVEAQLTNVPDSVKKILGKLTISEQLDWLADPENSINKRTQTPKTPIERRGTDSKEVSEVRQVI